MAFGLFKKKKEKKDNRYKTLKVKEVVHIAKDAVNLVFEPQDDFDYEPGQFITIIDKVNGEKVRRAYSLCTTPFVDDYPAVTVKRVSGGRMSNHLNDNMKEGDLVEIMEPMGMFTTTYNETQARHAVFFGGGSGITPLYSILRSVLIKEPNSKVSLVYGNRSDAYIIFRDSLKQLQEKYGDRLQVIHILEEGAADYSGRMNTSFVKEVTDKLGCDAATEFHICGPQPMMDVVVEGLSASGYSQDKIRLESFEAGKTSPKEIIAAASDGANESEVSIILDGERHEITVDKSKPVLDAALDKGLDMPYSCQSGLCTACRGKCVEGEISVDEAEGLSQDELNDGYVLTCVGKPLSDRIVVEIG